MTRTCPECSAKMCTEVIHGVHLDICPECAGIWFDFEELRTLLAQDPLVMSELEDRTMPHGAHKPIGTSLRHCPDCHLPLQQYRYLYTSPIVLEACTDCGGFFVEDGQLGKMQQWLDQSHKP